ncbi:MAG: MFS transporter [Saprospiraceae bacterium]|nr:MFS transporter [Saprospiraceae bacterium]
MQNETPTTPSVNTVKINDPRTMNGWAFFDCANSAHSLVITTAVFPPFFAAVAPAEVEFLGSKVESSAMLAYAITISYAVIAFTSPTLSGVADYGGKRKFFMRIFTMLGAISCMAMFFMERPDEWQIGFWTYVLAMIGYAGGVVFNNAYLPIIATPDKFDSLSARGFTYGYIGSTLLLVVNLAMILFYDKLGFPDKGIPTRLAFIMVGVWWLGFSQITFNRMPKDANTPLSMDIVSRGFGELKKVFQTVKSNFNLKRYLASFFFFDSGVQTMLFLATVFATKELGFETTELIVLVLILQLVAAGGAFLFAKLSGKKGNKFALVVMLCIWILITFLAFFIKEKTAFYALGGLLGFVQGGIQSLARATYAKLMPEGTKDTTSFYSFYDLTDKLAVIMGTFVFGSIDQIIGIRYSVLAMGILFVIGIILILPVKIPRTTT